MWCLLINNVPYCLRLLTETYFLMIIEHNTWRDLVQSLAERLKHIPVLNVCVDHRYMLLFHSFYPFFFSCFHQITTGVAVSIILSCVLFSSAGQMSIDSLMTESSLENQRDKGTQSKAAD